MRHNGSGSVGRLRGAVGVAAVIGGLWSCFAAPAEAGLFGPYPYLQPSDSPFFGVPFARFHLEDFEDGRLNTPGVTLDNGIVKPSGLDTDSVDGDDGALDGFGGLGASLTNGPDGDGVNRFVFTFDPVALGRFPDHVGIIFTDGAPGGSITFEAFDELGFSLATQLAFVGDDSPLGETAEDRFFGVAHEFGVSKIIISDLGAPQDLELDHLQYGYVVPVPEPSTLLLAMLAAGGAVIIVRRRRL